MNISKNYNHTLLNKRYTPKFHKASFKGALRTDVKPEDQNVNSGVISKINGKIGKIKTLFLAGLVALSGTMACNTGRSCINDSENRNGIEVRYYGVDKETKDSLLVPLENLKSKLTEENDFLKGVQVDVAKDYSSLDDNDGFARHLKTVPNTDMDKGVSFYSDGRVQKKIVIQEDAHGLADKLLSSSDGGEFSTIPAMRHTLIHEAGHHFDSYFGHDHNADFAQKWDSIVANKENPYTLSVEERDKDARAEYFFHADLSDGQDFKDALLKDMNHIVKLKKTNPKRLACGIDYYTQGMDISKKVTAEDVYYAEFARSEVYANLFAYAMGENDGDKTDFVDNFKNSYNVVKNDIAKYLNIEK